MLRTHRIVILLVGVGGVKVLINIFLRKGTFIQLLQLIIMSQSAKAIII